MRDRIPRITIVLCACMRLVTSMRAMLEFVPCYYALRKKKKDLLHSWRCEGSDKEKKMKRKMWMTNMYDETSRRSSMRNWDFEIVPWRNIMPGHNFTSDEILYWVEICVPGKRFFRTEYFVPTLYLPWTIVDWLLMSPDSLLSALVFSSRDWKEDCNHLASLL